MKPWEKKKSIAEQATTLDIFNHGMMLPHDNDLEKSILGTLLVSDSMVLVAPILKDSDFYSEKNRTVYKAMIEIFKRGEKIDILSTVRQLKTIGKIEFVGGSKAVATLSSNNYDRNTEKTALYLVELSRKRQLICLVTNINSKAYSDVSDVFELIGETQSGILELLDFKFSKETNYGIIANKTLKEITAKKENTISGIASKFGDLNAIIGGYRYGNLTVVAARPKMGKSTFLVNEAHHMALNGFNVIVFTLEMPSSEVTKRFISIGTQVEGWKMDRNVLSNNELIALQNYVSNADKLPISVDDSAGIDFLYIASQIKKIKMKNEMSNPLRKGVDVVFIDYLQIMKLHGDNRNIGIGDVTRSLKTLAKDLEISIIIFSQLNRELETRGGNKKPQLSDLKESGSIEEDADVVLFLYRAENYGITEDENGESTTGIMEVIVEANRQGGNDTIKTKFIPTISTLLEVRTFDTTSNISNFENEVPKQSVVNF